MCKELRLPPSDPFIQQLDPFDLEFIEWSIVCDDPKLLEQIKNRYYDPEFDEWMEEFDKEQEELEKQQKAAQKQQNSATQQSKQQNVAKQQKQQPQQKQQKQPAPPPVELPDAETVEWSNRKPPTRQTPLPTEEYEVGDTSQFNNNDWERED